MFGRSCVCVRNPQKGSPPFKCPGEPWSDDDLADLKDTVRRGRTPREIAEYLQREVLEVEAKIAERFG
jgi:hypothetical protein